MWYLYQPLGIQEKAIKERYTKSQEQEIKDLITRLENLQLYGDEESGEPKGEMVNYVLFYSNS